MSLGLIGKKIGMTRIFNEAGNADAVSVIEIFPTKVTEIKSLAKDGYNAVQVAYYSGSKAEVNQAMLGVCKKLGIPQTRSFKEFQVENESDLGNFQLGMDLTSELFAKGQIIDVGGVTKGKGFAGTIKRHHFRGQDATHGNSRSHRVPGSIGQRQSPGKVFKNKKMCGQLGSKKRTIQNLEILSIDAAKNLVLVKGAVPGAKGTHLVLLPAVKQ